MKLWFGVWNEINPEVYNVCACIDSFDGWNECIIHKLWMWNYAWKAAINFVVLLLWQLNRTRIRHYILLQTWLDLQCVCGHLHSIYICFFIFDSALDCNKVVLVKCNLILGTNADCLGGRVKQTSYVSLATVHWRIGFMDSLSRFFCDNLWRIWVWKS